MDVLELRTAVYRHFAEQQRAPSRADLVELVDDAERTDALLTELHDRHMLVLDDRPGRVGEIRMALPFSAEPTDHAATVGERTWWANCAWDALAILAALHADGEIRSVWADTREPVRLAVSNGELAHADGHIYFSVPARHWWDDIVFT